MEQSDVGIIIRLDAGDFDTVSTTWAGRILPMVWRFGRQAAGSVSVDSSDEDVLRALRRLRDVFETTAFLHSVLAQHPRPWITTGEDAVANTEHASSVGVGLLSRCESLWQARLSDDTVPDAVAGGFADPDAARDLFTAPDAGTVARDLWLLLEAEVAADEYALDAAETVGMLADHLTVTAARA